MPPNDPSRIEVQLGLLSGRDSEAALRIAAALESITASMSAFKAQDFVQASERLGVVAEKLKAENERAAEQAAKMQLGGALSSGASSVERTAQTMRSALASVAGSGQSGARSDVAAAHEANTERARASEEDRRRSERERMDAQREAIRARVEGLDYDRPVDPLTGEVRGQFRIPRFGELNIQDYLNLLRDRRVDKAAGASLRGDTEGATSAEQQAKILHKLSGYAGMAYGISHGLRTTGARLSAQGLNPLDEGVPLGYARDSNPFSDVLGMQTPFSSYGAEDARQMRDTIKMRLQAGINQEQAQAITQASAQAGFGGDLGSDIRMQFLAPQFRRYGVDPQALIPFTQILRTGTGGINDLNDALADLGEVARSANLNVNDAAQALAQAGEAAQQMGGSFERGVDYGRVFMQGTGLPSDVGNRLGQNNIVQGFIAARTGLPGQAQGALPASTRMQGTRDALAAMVGAFQGSVPGYTQEIRDPATGEVVTRQRMSGRDAAIGMAAQQLGINYDEARAIMSRTDRQTQVEYADALAMDYENKVSRLSGEADAGGMGAAVTRRRREGVAQILGGGRFDREGNLIQYEGAPSTMSGSRRVKNIIKHDSEEMEDAREQWVTTQITGEKNARGRNALQELHRAARRMGVSQEDWEKNVDEQDDPRKKAIAARRLVADKVAEEKAKYEIRFTGEAEKYFKALAKEARSHGWDIDAPTNAQAAGPGAFGLNDASASAPRGG